MLNRPWEEFLVLSSRVAHGLHQAQVKTLQEAIVASQGDELLTLRNFGTRSLCDLRQEVARLKPQLVPLCLELPSSINSVVPECRIECDSVYVKESLSFEDSIECLHPSSLATSLLVRIGVNTVADLLHLSSATLKTMPGVGVMKIREIEALIERSQDAISVGSDDEEISASGSSVVLGVEVSPPEQSDEIAAILDRPWDEFLVLSVRAAHGLHNAKIKTLREAIVASKDNQLLKLRFRISKSCLFSVANTKSSAPKSSLKSFVV